MGISNGVAEHDAALASDDAQLVESGTRPVRDSAQSGVRAAPAFGARIEAALATSARTEATLSDLFRTVKFLSATIGTVREANAGLARELESLAEVLGGGGDERTALAGRIQRLEKVVVDAARVAETERSRLLSEHDKFIAMLLADHERDLGALRRRLGELEGARPAEKP